MFCMMSEGSRDEQTAKQLKRANEENEDCAERVQAAKRTKAEGEHAEDDKKYPKRKVVLLMAYSGKGYYGMQVLTSSFFSLFLELCFLMSDNLKHLLCYREILELLSFGPLKMIWSLLLLNLLAFLKTMART